MTTRLITTQLITTRLRFSYLVLFSLLSLGVLSGCAGTRSPSDYAHNAPAVDLFLLSVNAQRAYQESRWLEAVRLYQQIVEHVPEDAAAWFHLANTYVQQGAFDRAIHAYEQSLKQNSEQPKAWFNLSTAYLMHAQSAMRQSHTRMRVDNASRTMVEQRMSALGDLVR